MPSRTSCTRIVAAIAAGVLGSLAWAGVAVPKSADLSANWSGYVATGSSFSGVSATWTVPVSDCLAKQSGTTAASFWVGLGGSLRTSNKIEQIGTDSDCNPDGTDSYYAWYELWPGIAVTLSLDIAAGDRVRATVHVAGDRVKVGIANLTTGDRFGRTLHFGRPDRSSAEWITEAPAMKVRHGTPYLSLTKFGSVTFTHATATANGQTETIGGGAWKKEAIRLDSLPSRKGTAAEEFLSHLNRARVVPSRLASGGAAFSVTWAEAPSTPKDPLGAA